MDYMPLWHMAYAYMWHMPYAERHMDIAICRSGIHIDSHVDARAAYFQEYVIRYCVVVQYVTDAVGVYM